MTMDTVGETLRIDKWLWHARFFKSRSQAGAAVAEGAVRVNGAVVAKAARGVRPGDVVDVVTGGRRPVARRVRVVGLGERRGPAPEARALYDELAAPVVETGW